MPTCMLPHGLIHPAYTLKLLLALFGKLKQADMFLFCHVEVFHPVTSHYFLGPRLLPYIGTPGDAAQQTS